jgi:hypothetical protein
VTVVLSSPIDGSTSDTSAPDRGSAAGTSSKFGMSVPTSNRCDAGASGSARLRGSAAVASPRGVAAPPGCCGLAATGADGGGLDGGAPVVGGGELGV